MGTVKRTTKSTDILITMSDLKRLDRELEKQQLEKYKHTKQERRTGCLYKAVQSSTGWSAT